MKRILIFLCLNLLTAVYARQFVGLPSSFLIGEDGVVRFVGVQVGTYDLGSGLGLRADAEFVPLPADGPIVQGGVDLLYSTGERTVLYAGAGVVTQTSPGPILSTSPVPPGWISTRRAGSVILWRCSHATTSSGKRGFCTCVPGSTFTSVTKGGFAVERFRSARTDWPETALLDSTPGTAPRF